jgi:hypothetical protein
MSAWWAVCCEVLCRLVTFLGVMLVEGASCRKGVVRLIRIGLHGTGRSVLRLLLWVRVDFVVMMKREASLWRWGWQKLCLSSRWVDKDSCEALYGALIMLMVRPSFPDRCVCLWETYRS